MKKVLYLLLAVMMVLSFTACGEKQNEGDQTTTTSTEQITTTESGEETVTTTKVDGDVTTTGKNKTTTAATTTTTTTTKKTTAATTTAKPAKLNPKTAFTFGKYTAAFLNNNNQTYRKVSLYFYEEFNTVQADYTEFYTIEQCKKQYESWGSDFDENNFSYESKLTVGGVTYYDIGNWGNLPTMYELTDTLIKTGEGDESEGLTLGAFAEFSLNQNGTLSLEKDHGVFGKKGTVYTFKAE